MNIATQKGLEFEKELSKHTNGWEVITSSYNNGSTSILVSQNLSVDFSKEGEISLSVGKHEKVTPVNATALRMTLKFLKMEPSYQTFLLNKNIEKLIEKTDMTNNLLSGGIEFSPGSDAVKELEKNFASLVSLEERNKTKE